MRCHMFTSGLALTALFALGAASATPLSAQTSSQAAFAGNGSTYSDPAPATSVAELARASRARKASAAKSVKIFDEQNMPRAPIAEGQQAPGVSGSHVTLIDFWATWCGPCRQSLPGLKQLHAIYGEQVEVVSVNEEDDQDDWRAFVANNGMNWTQKFDAGHQMMQQYGATGLPTYVLIGKDGHVVKTWVGDDEGSTLVDRIGDDLKKSIDAKL